MKAMTISERLELLKREYGERHARSVRGNVLTPAQREAIDRKAGEAKKESKATASSPSVARRKPKPVVPDFPPPRLGKTKPAVPDFELPKAVAPPTLAARQPRMIVERTKLDRIGPTELINAATAAIRRAEKWTLMGRPDAAAVFYDDAQELIYAADVLRGLHLEPGYEFRPLAANRGA